MTQTLITRKGFWIEFLTPYFIASVASGLAWHFKLMFPTEPSNVAGVLSSSISLCAIIAGLSGVILALFPTITSASIWKIIKDKNLEKPIFIYIGFSVVLSCSLIIYNIKGYFSHISILKWVFLMTAMMINFLILVAVMIAILMDLVKNPAPDSTDP